MSIYNTMVGSDHLRGNGLFGKRRDYTYNVPPEAITVYMQDEDNSCNGQNIGSGNGKATLSWSREDSKAHVHAWVNGAIGGSNEIEWKVYATCIRN
jgi:hypothetical protein